MWESHSEQKRGHSGVSDNSLFRQNSLRTVGCPEVESRIPVPVASVVQSDIVGPERRGVGATKMFLRG